MLDSEGTFKIKVRLPWTIFEILFASAVMWFKDFLMETRLPNIFQTTNQTFKKPLTELHKLQKNGKHQNNSSLKAVEI